MILCDLAQEKFNLTNNKTIFKVFNSKIIAIIRNLMSPEVNRIFESCQNRVLKMLN